MVANYNDLLRKQIASCFSNGDDYETILNFFYNLSDDNQELIMRLALADLYKINYYNEGEVSKLFQVPIEQIVDKCITDVALGIEVLSASKIINDMDYVSKTLLLGTMTDNALDSNISSIYKFHILDKLTYVILDDLEYYKEYYKEYLEVNKELPNRITVITNYISYRVEDLKQENEIKYKKYILEFLKEYYKWKNFIKNHEGEYIINKNDFIYLDIIDSKSIEEIFVYIEENFDFLTTIVGEYLHYKTQKIELKEKIVNDFYNNSVEQKIKEKLK